MSLERKFSLSADGGRCRLDAGQQTTKYRSPISIHDEVKDLILDHCDTIMLYGLKLTHWDVRRYVNDYMLNNRVFEIDLDHHFDPKLLQMTNNDPLKYEYHPLGTWRQLLPQYTDRLMDMVFYQLPTCNLDFMSRVRYLSIRGLGWWPQTPADYISHQVCEVREDGQCVAGEPSHHALSNLLCVLERWCPHLQGVWCSSFRESTSSDTTEVYDFYQVNFKASSSSKFILSKPSMTIEGIWNKGTCKPPRLTGPLKRISDWYIRRNIERITLDQCEKMQSYDENVSHMLDPLNLKDHQTKLSHTKARHVRTIQEKTDAEKQLMSEMGPEDSEQYIRFALRLEKQVEASIPPALKFAAYVDQHPTARTLLDMVRGDEHHAAIKGSRAYRWDDETGRWKTREKYSVASWARRLKDS
ncbi:hypothetical protein BT63DRAFT_410890 [Microthyrium microscopicum]|uniref:Uncharacterized protein n=1 Tax=Microthyrium microscopicum TaxID=703497 RepID=A0A6A6USL9_9PEZI|nr:hypothetical protein BT63DRAFT_410890 [Microthyrium microscopicum]